MLTSHFAFTNFQSLTPIIICPNWDKRHNSSLIFQNFYLTGWILTESFEPQLSTIGTGQQTNKRRGKKEWTHITKDFACGREQPSMSKRCLPWMQQQQQQLCPCESGKKFSFFPCWCLEECEKHKINHSVETLSSRKYKLPVHVSYCFGDNVSYKYKWLW